EVARTGARQSEYDGTGVSDPALHAQLLNSGRAAAPNEKARCSLETQFETALLHREHVPRPPRSALPPMPDCLRLQQGDTMEQVFGKVALTLLLATSFSAAAQTPAVRVAAGAYHACAILTNGTVTCWGYNYYG